MKRSITILLFLLITFNVKSQSLYYPPLAGNNWDTLSPSSLGWCTDKIPDLLNYLDSKNSKAFIVLKDGKIVIEKYFGTFTRDSNWYWASAGKSLTSFMVGIAKQEGYLKLTDTTSKYLGKNWTSMPLPKENLITIRHQLTMTTGLDDGVTDNSCTLDTCLQYIADAGNRWAYHNAPYTLLDKVILSATGQNLNAYINQKLKPSTGMTGAFIPSGYNNVFWSKPRSMARYGLLILGKGNWNGTQVMTDTAYLRQMVNTSQTINPAYGYLWWLNGKSSFRVPTLQTTFPGPLNPSAPSDMIAALGKNGQIINIVPSQNLVYIRMGNAPGVGEVPILFNDTVWQKLNKVMCNLSSVKKTSSISEPRIYPNPAANTCTIELSGGNFKLNLTDIQGRILITNKECKGSFVIGTETFPEGVYFIELKTSQNIEIRRKLIICR